MKQKVEWKITPIRLFKRTDINLETQKEQPRRRNEKRRKAQNHTTLNLQS